jgi:hypothetical protein
MDRIKVEPNLEAVATPLFSPGEEKCIDIKEEECHSGPQICLIKEEVSVSIFSQNTVLQCTVWP